MRRTLLTLLVLGALASPAAASPALDAMVARSQVVLAHELHSRLVPRPVLLGTPEEMGLAIGLAYTDPAHPEHDRISVSAGVMVGLEEVAANPMLARRRGGSLHVLVHEQIHTGRTGYLEEGLDDAEVYDLMPAWSMAVLGVRVESQPVSYTGAVRAVRNWSVRVTGRPWRSAEARRARRELLETPSPQREAAYAAGWRSAEAVQAARVPA